jgi:hypothetical protein
VNVLPVGNIAKTAIVMDAAIILKMNLSERRLLGPFLREILMHLGLRYLMPNKDHLLALIKILP